MEYAVEDEAFRRACGLQGPLILEVIGPTPDQSRVVAFDQPWLIIGRDPRSDLVLDHVDISRRHAYLQAIQGRVIAFDLDSRGGLWFDDRRVLRVRLTGEADLILGPYRIRVRSPLGPPADAGDDEPTPTEPLPPLALEIRSGPDALRAWLVRPSIALIGSAPTCRIRIEHEDMSRHQTALIRTAEGVWAVDLLGRDGLAVNDMPARAARIEDGDVLRAGHIEFNVRLRPAAAPGALATRPNARPPATIAPPPAPRPASPPSFILPSTPGLPADAADQLAPLLGMVTAHFEQTHKQMMEGFQQAMAMVGQTFGQLYSQQSAQVREELEHMRRIQYEIAYLKGQLEAAPSPPPAAAPPVTDPVAAPAPNPVVPPAAPPPRVVPRPASQPVGSPDLHLDLAKRIADLQSEEQSHWKRLMGLISRSS